MTTTHAGAPATARDELVERLDAHVREVVRREGVDPQADAGVVRRIAESVVRDHDERSLTGVVAAVHDAEGVVGELVARVSGFGPLQPFLDDPAVEEVWINSPDRVFVARHGRHELTNLVLTRAQVHELVERMLKSSGRRIDLSQPFVDAMLPEGHRLHVVLEGIIAGLQRRQHPQVHASAPTACRAWSSSAASAHGRRRSSRRRVRAGLNILVAGGTQAGKTTMLNCLAAAIPGGDRVVSAEEVYELRFTHPDWVALQTRQRGLEGTGEVRLRDLVKESLRMRPSRVIVGEVRAEECLDLLLALNAGLPGDVHDPRQQRARGAGEVLHAAAAGRREHLGAVRGADRRGQRRPGRPPRASTSTAYAGSTRSSACRAGSRTTSSRPSRSSCGTAPSCGAPEGCRRGSSSSSAAASTCTGSSADSRRDKA